MAEKCGGGGERSYLKSNIEVLSAINARYTLIYESPNLVTQNIPFIWNILKHGEEN